MYPQRFIAGGSPGTTEKITSSDSAAATLPDSIKYRDGSSSNEGRNKAKAVIIEVENNAIRYAYGTDPTQDGGTGLGHILSAGDILRLDSWDQINDFRYITKTGTSHATLQITPEY